MANPSGDPTDNCAKMGKFPVSCPDTRDLKLGQREAPPEISGRGKFEQVCNSRSIILSRNGAQEAPLGTVSRGWY